MAIKFLFCLFLKLFKTQCDPAFVEICAIANLLISKENILFLMSRAVKARRKQC